MPGRTYSANSEYRYGFNGKENDKDISEGGQDYGMRISDSRLARFLSVDPLAKNYPFYTPYQFAGNSPLANIDLDGEEPKWMVKMYEFLKPFTFSNSDLIKGGYKNKVYDQVAGSGNFDRKNFLHILRFHQILGKIFEDVVLRSMNKSKNEARYYADPQNKKDWFVPDEIHETHWIMVQASRSSASSVTKDFPNAGIIEVKSTKDVAFDPSYGTKNDPQMKKQIDYLAQVKDQYGELAADYGAATLHIVAPAFTTIDPEIIKYATSKNVRLYSPLAQVCKQLAPAP